MIKIAAVGDIMPGGVIHSTSKEKYIAKSVCDLMLDADIRIGTLESAIGDVPNFVHEKMIRQGDVIYSKCEDIYKLKDLNIDVVSLANNHIHDLDCDGISQTITLLNSIGVKHFGAGRNIAEASAPAVFEISDKTIAFLGFCDWRQDATGYCMMATDNTPGVNPMYEDHVEKEIKKAKSKYDFVVVVPHWGKEHTYWPANYVYDLSRKMIESGADVVLGGHTHRVQPVISFRGKCIVYSLGNFLFADRVIVPPRSTWYPDSDIFDYSSLPKTEKYPYVNEPTLKLSPAVNRVGQVVEVSMSDNLIQSKTTLTYMDKKCCIDFYRGGIPYGFVKICIRSGLYKQINKTRLFGVKMVNYTKIAMNKLNAHWGKLARF